MDKEGLEKFNKIYPWFTGLSSDLLFWVAIDTLFLTVVKGFNAAQIVSLTTISLITCICLQIPLLKIITKIGNTSSVRLSAFLLLMSSILLTFGNNYLVIVLGKLLYEIAFTFQGMASATLKNNLALQNREDEYVKFNAKSATIYSVVTMIISFVASVMFNLNNYLPMVCCIMFCFICFILSFNIIDFSSYNKISKTDEKKCKKKKVKYSKLIIVLIISFGLFYPIVNSGQSNGKLFIQQELMKDFDVEKTALIIGAMLCISRIVRVASNIVFSRAYDKLKDKMSIILPIILVLSIITITIGSFISISVILKIVVMSLGYIMILFIRDPFNIYIKDLGLKNIPKTQQQGFLTTLQLARKIIRAIISFAFTIILIDFSMIVVMVI